MDLADSVYLFGNLCNVVGIDFNAHSDGFKAEAHFVVDVKLCGIFSVGCDIKGYLDNICLGCKIKIGSGDVFGSNLICAVHNLNGGKGAFACNNDIGKLIFNDIAAGLKIGCCVAKEQGIVAVLGLGKAYKSALGNRKNIHFSWICGVGIGLIRESGHLILTGFKCHNGSEGINGIVVNSALVEIDIAHGVAVALALVSDIETVIIPTGLAVAVLFSYKSGGQGLVCISEFLVVADGFFGCEIIICNTIGEICVDGSIVNGILIVKVAVEKNLALFVLGNVVYPEIKFIDILAILISHKGVAVAGISDHTGSRCAVGCGTAVNGINAVCSGCKIVAGLCGVGRNGRVKLIGSPGLEVNILLGFFAGNLNGYSDVVHPLGMVSAITCAAPMHKVGDILIIKFFTDNRRCEGYSLKGLAVGSKGVFILVCVENRNVELHDLLHGFGIIC